MSNIIIPTSYIPSVAYMSLLMRHRDAIVEVCETFPKQTYRNRAEILTSNGILRLSVPVVRTNGNHTLTRNIGISYAERWNVQHVRAIESAYNASPYFMYLWDGLNDILMRKHDRLLDLNEEVLVYLIKILGVEVCLRKSEDYQEDVGDKNDYRNMFAHGNGEVNMPSYYQVWGERYGFCANLSVIDLIFNIGPAESKEYLEKLNW